VTVPSSPQSTAVNPAFCKSSPFYFRNAEAIPVDHWSSAGLASTVFEGPEAPGNRAISVNEQERSMNWDQIQGNWKQLTGKVQQKWGKLTDDDLDRIEGNAEELRGKIQERYGKSKEEAQREVDEWRKSL
jgi:uncharacterized protein YjbJ (UPF0337 family)